MASIINHPRRRFNYSSYDSFCITKPFQPGTKIDTSLCRFNGTLYLPKEKDKDGLNITYRLVYGYPRITVKGEFGQVLYGSNLFTLDTQGKIDRALYNISDKVSRLFDISFDAFTAKVTWLDAFRDFSLEDKSAYLVTLKKHELSRLHRENYKVKDYYNGFIFANNSRRTRVYDKWAQLLDKQRNQVINRQKRLPDLIRDFAKTLVRTEVHLTRRPLIAEVKEFFGTDDRSAGRILTLEFAEHIIDKGLASLELNRDIPTFAEYELLLRQNFNPRVAARVINYMSDLKRVGEAQIKQRNLNRYNNRKSQLSKRGLWQTVFAENRLLPLTVFGNDDESWYLN